MIVYFKHTIHCIVVTRRGRQPLSAVGDKQAQSQTDSLHMFNAFYPSQFSNIVLDIKYGNNVYFMTCKVFQSFSLKVRIGVIFRGQGYIR